jgi:K+-transporting ATPase ATPase B chain
MKRSKQSSLFPRGQVTAALKQSFVKLNPATMLKNPVMFTVYIGTFIMLFVCVWIGMGEKTQGSLAYNIAIFLVLFITLLFANFAEAIAEARGKHRQTVCAGPVKTHRQKDFCCWGDLC